MIKKKLLEDIYLVEQYRWHITSKKYVRTTINGKIYYLHRLLLKVDDNKIIDHINQNPLDNRRNNLRIGTLSLNRINSKININNTSGYRGVIYRKGVNKWESSIIVNGKKIYLAETLDKELAIQRRINAEQKFYNINKVII